MNHLPPAARRLYFLALVSLLAIGVAGCSRSGDSGATNVSTPTASTAPASQPAVAGPPPDEIRIGYFANITHAQAVLGVASGDFAAAVAPSKLTTRVFNAGPSLIEALFSGALDIGYVGPGPAVNAWAKSHGEGIRVIAGSCANGVLIVARDGSGINSLADLKGKTLATPQAGNTQDTAARHYLKDVLGQDSFDNVLPIANSEQAAMMDRGRIDASWAPEPWGSLLVSQCHAKIIAQESDLWPNHEFALTLVITTPDFLKAHPDIVAKILAVHHKYTKLLAGDPQSEAKPLGDALATLTHRQLKPEVIASSLSHCVFTDDPLPDTLSTMTQWSLELGVIKQQTSLDGLVDDSIVKGLPQ